MTTRTRIFLLALAVAAFLTCACLDVDDDARTEWFNEVNSRQRGLERPTATAVVEVIP